MVPPEQEGSPLQKIVGGNLTYDKKVRIRINLNQVRQDNFLENFSIRFINKLTIVN